MTRAWAGRTAFITGGARGIGLGIARALAAEGVQLALADIDAEALDRARVELEGRAIVRTFVLDVRDRSAFARVADDAEAALGPVSLLFNNAGVAAGCDVTQMTYEHWDWVLGVNLDGVVNGIQTFVPRMIAAGNGGYVVNTSSGAGLVSTHAGFLYTTSKFAVVGLSEALHLELGPHGVGVSVLCPGPVATDIVHNTYALNPEARPLSPEVAASLEETAAFLRTGVTADEVGRMVVAAMKDRRLHIMTDDLIADLLRERAQRLEEALPGPERLEVS